MPINALQKKLPPELYDKVATDWRSWQQACAQQGLPERLNLDLAELGYVWACSDFVAQYCYRQPQAWLDLLHSGWLDKPQTAADLQQQLAPLLSSPPLNDARLMTALRRFRQQQMVRIAWRDLTGRAQTTETLRDLTNLAEVIVDLTLECLYQDQLVLQGQPYDAQGNPQRLVVLGMGKLGGFELNYSSDIDLIFAYGEEGQVAGKSNLSSSQFFTRLGQRLIKVLNDLTADGFVFRVDMRLRPFGDSGPLVMSFDGMEQYYQSQGRDWERYAMIKARVIGGDREKGAQLLAMLRPFVYRRYLDFGAFESIREMKAMIDGQIRRKGNEHNIKLGPGGIREIEFIGQTLQLIRGGADKALQTRSILKVLRRLADRNYLSQQAAAELAEDYDFLRRLENRLQMYRDEQTHVLPEDPLRQQSLALAMHCDSWDTLMGQVSFHRQRVQGHFNHILAANDPQHEAAEAISLSQMSEDDCQQYIEDHELALPAGVAARLSRFFQLSMLQKLSATERQRLDKLIPMLLGILQSLPMPVEALERILNLLQAIVRRSVYLSLLIEYPQALRQLVRLCAASPWIASLLSRYPVLLDQLLDPREFYALPGEAQMAQELAALIARCGDDEERKIEVLRQFKQASILKVAALDVSGLLPVFDVSDQLSRIAQVLLQQSFDMAWQHMCGRHGYPAYEQDGKTHRARLAIIAYGKMGGQEMGYGSDLDIVFLHDSQGRHQQTITENHKQRALDNSVFFARLAQRIIHIISIQTANGRLYEVDMRLRPDGAAGMLVSSLKAYEIYQREKAWTWEHQALIRARMVLGSPHIGEEFDRIRRSALLQHRDDKKLRQDVVEMRQKMREALGSKKPGYFHLKQDEGGMVDIEFLVQYCVLKSAADYPQLLQYTSTRQLLQALGDAVCLTAEQIQRLTDIYCEYRACSHQRALQEQTMLLDEQMFISQRNEVKQIWQNLLPD